MIVTGGLCLMLYIVFNWAFHGPGNLKDTLWESANKTMDGSQLVQFNNIMPELTQAFGIACVLCFALSIVFFLVDILQDSGRGGGY